MSSDQTQQQDGIGGHLTEMITECSNCASFFDAQRRGIGDPFRCSSCGHKHKRHEVAENRPDEIISRVKRLVRGETERSLKSKLADLNLDAGRDLDSSLLYIMQNSDGLVKIGISKHPDKRAYDIRGNMASDVWVVDQFPVENARGVESRLHSRFSEHNEFGEWFDLSESTVDDLQSELRSRVNGTNPDTVALERTGQATLTSL